MFNSSLAQAVNRFAQVTQSASEIDLDRPWAWGPYDSEGVRFAMFRTYEELRDLATQVEHQRLAAGQAATSTQRLLGHYHAADRDLEVALLGLDEQSASQAPEEGQWSVQQAYAHLTQADIGFYVLVRFALDHHRAGDWQPVEIPEAFWDEMIGIPDEELLQIMHGPFAGLQAYHRDWHGRIISDLVDISEAELELPSMYWENQPYPLRFRLGRFESHLRQHTVQIDKTLAAIGRAPTEAQRLLRLIYNALAEVESASLGAEDLVANLGQPTATSIASRAEEISVILTHPTTLHSPLSPP